MLAWRRRAAASRAIYCCLQTNRFRAEVGYCGSGASAYSKRRGDFVFHHFHAFRYRRIALFPAAPIRRISEPDGVMGIQRVAAGEVVSGLPEHHANV